ncbi:unnamed protein product [Phytophthora fragariaefolia]|uniref:Unnamed protein product n=1 Tax=Phytophthora fragariaefolia TaxID=1490495 RepID=A0A9W7CUY4_9STRA|nr:unnamed protein product [Phytophthora fragariaefolia]
MGDAQDAVTSMQPCSTPPTPLHRNPSRKTIRGVAVAPYLGASPKRGSSVLHNVHGRALPTISICTAAEEALSNMTDKDSPTRTNSRRVLQRSSSFSQVIHELSTSHLRTLDSIDILSQNCEQLQDDQPSPQGSPRPGTKMLPRRRSYALHNEGKSDPKGKLLHQGSLLKNLRDMTTIVAKPPGTVEGSPEKKTPVAAIQRAQNPSKQLPSSEKREAFIIAPLKSERHSNHTSAGINIFGYSVPSLYDLWESLQVSHCGQYSIERMLALDEYCQRVSIVRVLAVCVLFPLGPLLIVILIECMPLQPVEKGVLANYVFWIRHTIMGSFLVFCAMVQARVWIPDMVLSTKQVLVVAVSTSVIYTALDILIAEIWVFPIPFFVVAGAPLMFSIWAITSRIVLGPHPLQGVPDGQFRGRRLLLLLAVHASLLGIYPAYQAVFLEVDGIWELAMIALLPAINLFLKNVQTALGSHLEDSLPEVIVFSVDVFNAIYSVLCMHSASSIKMIAITLVLNTLMMMLSLHGMNRRSQVARACRSFQIMEQQQQKLRRRQSVLDSFVAGGCNPALLSTMVTTTLRMLQAPGQLDSQELSTIRLLSSVPHKLSKSNTSLLDWLAARSVYINSRRTTVTTSVSKMKSRFSSAAMEGRLLSLSHFPSPTPPKSILAKRLRGAVLVVPASRWLSIRASSRTNSNQNGAPDFLKNKQDAHSKSTESEDSETDKFSQRPSTDSSDTAMLEAPTLFAPRLSQLIHATSDSTVRPIVVSPRLSHLPVSALWQETSDKLIALFSKPNSVIGTVLEETRKQNTRAVKQTLQLLFNNEYLGLIAYTQCIIPLIYLLYMPVLQVLPNHVYYPTHYRYFGVQNEFDERMTGIGSLTGLQLIVILALQIFVVKRFGISTIYQVAFVLETHFTLLQGRLLMWLIFAVQSTLVHYGKLCCPECFKGTLC